MKHNNKVGIENDSTREGTWCEQKNSDNTKLIFKFLKSFFFKIEPCFMFVKVEKAKIGDFCLFFILYCFFHWI